MKASSVIESNELIQPVLFTNRENLIKNNDIVKEKRQNRERSKSKDSFNFR